MAEGIRYVCGDCGRELEAWSDGNPYYLDETGKKKYAYHPDHEGLARCIGNDQPHVCLGCGAEIVVDSRAPISECPKCGAARLRSTSDLEGEPCPSCGKGRFARDPDFHVIS